MRVYVGETDNLGARIRQHANDEEKAFWDYACVISSKDFNLTKAHALYLEAKLIGRALLADRATLENTRVGPYENIPESDLSDMEYFFEQMTVILPALGYELFSPSALDRELRAETTAPPELVISADTVERRPSLPPLIGQQPVPINLRDAKFGIEATGLASNGQILVAGGSNARGQNDSEVNVYRPLRERLIKEGKLAQTTDPKVLVFATDVLFDSPSAASAVILDRNDNGRASWKVSSTGKSLNDWYATQANQVSQSKGDE